MLIDLFLVFGGLYIAYAITMSILDNGDTWATYKPKHAKKSKVVTLLQFGKEEIL